MNKKNHIIIIGWDDFAERVAKQIMIAGKAVTVVSDKKTTLESFNNDKSIENIDVIFTDYYDFKKIETANVEEALAVLINLENDTEKLKYVIPFNKYFKKQQIVVPINDANLKETFTNVGVTYPLSKNEIAAKMTSGFLFEKDVALYFEDLLASAEDESDYDIQQYKVLRENPLCHIKYGDAFKQLRNEYSAILIGLSQCDGITEKRSLLKNPPDETIINEGDYLILILNGKTADQLQKVFKVDEGAVL